MSAPRTNAAIADDLEAWADNVPPSQFAAGVLREAAAALRKEPPALPAEVEAVLANILGKVRDFCEVQSCETEPDRRYVADRVLSIINDEET